MRFNDTPNLDRPRYVLPVVTVRPSKSLYVIITSESWCGVDVHWNGTQNIVCPGFSLCEYCKQRQPQWQGFVTCERQSDGAQGLLRMTSNVIHPLRLAAAEFNGLIGLLCKFYRAGSRKNSPLMVTTHERLTPRQIWAEDEVKDHVARLFRMGHGGLADLKPVP